jgi:hypothetical protein
MGISSFDRIQKTGLRSASTRVFEESNLKPESLILSNIVEFTENLLKGA